MGSNYNHFFVLTFFLMLGGVLMYLNGDVLNILGNLLREYIIFLE
jgi:hypothetical protein